MRFVLLLISFVFTCAAAVAQPVDFAREILPLLSDNCFKCHGPDENARKAELRLDTKDGAFRVADGVAVITPGHSDKSELITRIFSTDPDEVMPTPKSNLQLTDAQKQLLKRWVDEGAHWGQHWSFTAMQKPVVPQVQSRTSPVRNPIDAFVLARLQQEQLDFSPEADKERLLRRVTFDLTGLPPTVPELDAFLADAFADAYEKVVERLLASPRFGERMAVDWLDLARFADTHGYQMDRFRAVWPYRDWVIKAFNENLPFDQFVTWQLAGDLLPNATKEQRLATAFNRLHSQNEEGGIVEEEFRVAYVVDRVNTMGTAFFGLTFECARCHDHKYDPISQRDFYQLFAFFQNIDESGQTTYFTDSTPVPALLLSSDKQDQQLAALEAKISAKERAAADLREQAGVAFEEWLKTKPDELTVHGCVAAFDFESLEKNQLTNSIDPGKPAKAHEQPKLISGPRGNAAELDGENGFTFPGVGHFTRADPFSLSLWLQTPEHAPRFVVAHHSKAPIDAGSRGYELLLEDGRVAFGLHHMWPGNSLKIRTKSALPLNRWWHVAVSYDGSSRAEGLRIYIDGAAADCEIVRDGLTKDITYEGGEPELAIGYRFRDAGFKGGRVDDFRVFNRALTPVEAAHLAKQPSFTSAWNALPEQLSAPQRGPLLDYFLANVHEPALALAKELHVLRDEQRRLINPIPEIMTMRELPQPKPAFVLKRGDYDAHGDLVRAATPHALPPFPDGAPQNRLGLAKWLLEPEHPLTARVTVNRLWQQMFGRGLVETSDNFGMQGAAPTHPELLDWLAREFIANGWDVKATLKKIAMSATYRQSSKAAPELLARDPANLLLARGPAQRLTAEMLRDQALAASELLVEKLGGPSVKPYQPPGLWEEIAMGKPRYDQGKGEDLHRRSLYTFWKRTVPPPAMVVFDAADRSYCTVKRQSTSTPLQALALLNDVQIVEAARVLAQRMFAEGGASLDEQLTWVFRAITSRRPSARELAICRTLFEEQRALFASESAAGAELLQVGEIKGAPTASEGDVAAATVLALAIFNHDEALMRR